MTRKSDQPKSQGAVDFLKLLDTNPTEEDIHQFVSERVFEIGEGNPHFSERFIAGTLSKFPVSPDRIPDFVSVLLNTECSQTPSRVTFIELKKPSALLFTSHSRMSKDLNDAWMECVEAARSMADGFRDCLRRIVESLDKERVEEFVRFAEKYDDDMPWCNSVIVIGRRATLDAAGLRRTKELSASTGYGIQVMTYDTVLDWFAEGDETWSFFRRGWYW